MADLSIFQGLLRPPKSVADYDQEAATTQGLRLQNTTRDLQNQTTQRGVERANQLLALSRGLPPGASDLDRLASLRNGGFYEQADALSKTLDDRTKTQAVAAKDTADAASTTQKTAEAKKSALLRAVPTFNGSDDVKKFLADGVAGGHLPMQEAQQMIAAVPDSVANPQGFKDWQLGTLRSLMAPEKQMEYVAPTANTVATNAASTANNAATNATSRANNAATNATSRANNAATIGKDYKVAGIDPQTGNFVGAGAGPDGSSGVAGIVDALGGYKIDPNTAFARMQPAMKAGIIAQVQAKYPDYDPTTYSAKRKAATDFTSGSQGNALRSFAVGLDHLDQFSKLADALDNGNVQVINQVGNAIARQTGNPAPTNFDTAKAVVGKEVIKAIVGAGGGVNERKEAEDLLQGAQSPKQLKGVVQTLTTLMRAQHDALLVQRRAAGLPDSTMPTYGGHGGAAAPAPAAPTGFKIVGVK
jgi:hypothetical protein